MGRALHPNEAEAGMAWVRLDHGFVEHPKIQRVGAFGLALMVRSISYCNRNLTDGFVPLHQAENDAFWCSRENWQSTIRLLVDAGLWEQVDGGFMIHDYLVYQFSRAETEDRAEQKRIAGQAGGQASARARAQAKSNPVPVPVPVPVPDSVPDPKPEKKDTVPASRSLFVKPSLEEVRKYCLERKNRVDPDSWIDHYESNGWRVGKTPMRSWKAAVRTWERSEFATANGNGHSTSEDPEMKKWRDNWGKRR